MSNVTFADLGLAEPLLRALHAANYVHPTPIQARTIPLLLQGRDRFGEPPAKIVALLDEVTDLGRLEALVIRLLHVKTWEELLGVNGTTRHPRARRKA